MEADLFQSVHDPLAPVTGVADVVDLQRLGNGIEYRESRIKRFEGILEDDLHLLAYLAQFLLAQVAYVPALEPDTSSRRLLEPRDRPDKRCLAASRFTDQGNDLLWLERQ